MMIGAQIFKSCRYKWFRDDSSTNKILVKAKDRNTGQEKDYVLGDVASIWNDTVMPGDYVDDDGYHSSSGESADYAIADAIAEQVEMISSGSSASESDDDGYNSSDVDMIRQSFSFGKDAVFYWPGFYEKTVVLKPGITLRREISNWEEPYKEVYSQVIDNVINKNETFTKLILTNDQINSLRAEQER